MHQALVSTISSGNLNSGDGSHYQNNNSKGKNNHGHHNWNNRGCNNKGALRITATTTVPNSTTHPPGVCLLISYMVVLMFHRHLPFVLLLWIFIICLQALTNKKGY